MTANIDFISDCDCPECQVMREQVALLEARHSSLTFDDAVVIKGLQEDYLRAVRAYWQSKEGTG